jgi:hypothetical protein
VRPEKAPPAQAVKSLTDIEKSYLLSAMLHFPDLFNSAKDKLLPEYFQPEEAQYAIFWRCIVKIAEDNQGRLPLEGLQNVVYMTVAAYLENEIKASHPAIYQQMMAQGGFFHQAITGFTKETMNRQMAWNCLQKFLLERRVFKKLAAIATQGNNTETLANIQSLHDEATRISGLGVTDLYTATHHKSSKPVHYIVPTGIDYFDERLNGGVSPGKVYGLLGPTGVGKTLNLVTLMVSSAIQEQIRYQQEVAKVGPNAATKMGMYYYFVYEGCKEDIQRRCMAYLAHIPLDRLTKYEYDPMMQLAGPGDERPEYETRFFPDGVGPYGENLASEVERYANANAILSRNVFVCEMIPSLENPKKGCGGIPEIQNILLAQKEEGLEVAGYYVDYAKLVAKNQVGSKLDYLRHVIGGMPNECVRQLNSYLPRAHGWIANQFNTDANRKSPTWVPSHSYASEAGDFGDNCWFTFCLGTRSQDDNCCLINCSKHRDFQPTPPSTLFIHGGFNRMVVMDNQIDLDRSMGTFVHNHNFERDDRGTLVVPFRRKTA